MSSGSGSRPGPESLPVSLPTAGSITWTPRERRVATLATVAGCSHISVCMAGAITTGAPVASSVPVSRSLAMPAAARANTSAVAGTITTRSASWPRRTWFTVSTASNTPVRTGLPLSASQVAMPTNCSEASVGITSTWWPASLNSRSSKAAL